MTCIKFDEAAWKEEGKDGLPSTFIIKSGACFEPPLSLITFVPTTRKPNSDCPSSAEGNCEIVNFSPALVCDGNSDDGNDSGRIGNCGVVFTLLIVVEDSSKVIKQD